MANEYTATILQDARAFLKDENNKKFELRQNMSKVLEAFMRDREFTIPGLSQIKEARIQATKALYMKNKAYTLTTAKSCAPSGESSGSGDVELTWAQLGFVVKSQTKKFQNNEVGRMKALANDLYNGEKSLYTGATGIDSVLATYLNANRTTVNAISTGNVGHNTWRGNPDYHVEVANADINRFYNYAQAEMAINNYDGELMDIVNTMWLADWQYYQSQGQANAVNTEFQFPGFTPYVTNLIQPAGYNGSIHYIVPTGGVAFLDWNNPLNLEGKISGQKEWTTAQSLLHPELTLDLYVYETCEDTTDDGGDKQDLVINYEFTLNYAIAKQPITASGETPIYKYITLAS